MAYSVIDNHGDLFPWNNLDAHGDLYPWNNLDAALWKVWQRGAALPR